MVTTIKDMITMIRNGYKNQLQRCIILHPGKFKNSSEEVDYGYAFDFYITYTTTTTSRSQFLKRQNINLNSFPMYMGHEDMKTL